MYLALAHQNRPADPAWARTFVRMAAALVDQCPRLPDGLHDFGSGSTAHKPANVAWAHYGYVANRLCFLLLTYLTLADSPEFSPAFHEMVLRVLAEHARHLRELGAHAFRDNYMNATAKALYLTAALLPELSGGAQGLEPMWPLLMQGIRREVLPDGCHMHRSFSYHLTFVKRPLDMLLVAHGIPGAPPIPGEFRAVVERAADAFARMSTPIRSTPGVNDDWTVANRFHHILAGAADVFGRDDLRWLATDGRQGTEPRERSCLLPDAQLIAMRAGWTSRHSYLFFNVSPNGGHYHPDPLSVQVWSGGDHLLIDPGVGHYYTGEREIARRSAWHNCPTLGAADLPTDLEPKVLHWEAGDDLDYAVGQVEIPGRQAAPPTRFRRHVFFVDRGCFVIYDEFVAVPAGREVWENFHFAAPDATVDAAGGRVVARSPKGAGLALFVASEGWELRHETASRWQGYGAPAQPTTLVHFTTPAAGAGRGFAAVIAPFTAGTAPPDVRFEVAGRRADGAVDLRLTAGGRQRVLTTRVRFDAEDGP
jgi:hypothetical protein